MKVQQSNCGLQPLRSFTFFTPSLLHSLTALLPHSLAPSPPFPLTSQASLPHPFTRSPPHRLTPSLLHPLTPSPPSPPHSLTPSRQKRKDILNSKIIKYNNLISIVLEVIVRPFSYSVT